MPMPKRGSLVSCRLHSIVQRLAGGIGDRDVAAEANDIGKAKIGKIREQLAVAEAAIGQDGHPATGRDNLRQAPQTGILDGVALILQLVFPH